MPVLFKQVSPIAKRGRKRWAGRFAVMRRFLCPEQLVRCGDYLLVVDEFQPAAAVLGLPDGELIRVVSWPSSGPEQGGWPGRLVCGDEQGVWIFDRPGGPLTRLAPSGEVATFPIAEAETLLGDAEGCWVARDPGWSHGTDPPPPVVVTHVGRDGTGHDVSVPGPVRRLRRQGHELLVDYYASGPQAPPRGGRVHYDIRTVTLPWPRPGKRPQPPPGEDLDPLASGALVPLGHQPVGQCGGLVWSRRHGHDLGLATWNRREALTGKDPASGATQLEIVLDGWISALGVTADAVWVTRRHRGPPAPPGQQRADLLRLPADANEPETVLPAESLDITEHCLTPRPPAGFDPGAYAQQVRDELAEFFFRGWEGPQAGSFSPFATGATTEAVTLSGAWPHTVVRVVFTHATRPGLRFVREIPVFDEAGRKPSGEYYPDVYLMEDIEAAGHGLPPPPDQCHPGPDGLIPF